MSLDDSDSELPDLQEELRILSRQPDLLKGGKLHPHQLDSLVWMATLHGKGLNGILADEMGMGKTIQTFAIIAYLHESRDIEGPHLVLAPKSTIPNWLREAKKWLPTLKFVHLDPQKDKRTETYNTEMKDGDFNVVITTYEALKFAFKFIKNFNWHLVVFDEAHKMKNEESFTHQQATLLKAEMRLLLTGTPLQTNMQELWAILNFLMPELFESDLEFHSWFQLTNEKQLEG